MKKGLMIASVLATICATAPAFDASQSFKSFVQSMLPKLENAFRTKDAKYFETISTADFTEKGMGKTYNKKQSMAEMKSMYAQSKSINCSFKLLSTKVTGKLGIATTSAHMVAVMKPMKKGDKSHRLVMDMVQKETFVRQGGGWKVKMIEDSKPSKMTMDGKPYTEKM